MIKNIVFDMGNVLTVYNAREYIFEYVDNEKDFRWIKNHLCDSVEWLQMDRGTITDEEAIRSICERMPEHLHRTVERFIREYRMVQPPNPPMERLVEELGQKGYHLYLMSNTSHRFRIFCKYIKSIAYMKGIWISCEHGLLKPEPEAYLDFFQTFCLKPEDCFFVDDKPANVEAARNLGMDGCVYYGDVAELRYFMNRKINISLSYPEKIFTFIGGDCVYCQKYPYKRNKRVRDWKHQQHLKRLCKITQHRYLQPVWYVDYIGCRGKIGERKVPYYKKATPNHGGRCRRYWKKVSNRQIRHYRGILSKGGSYKKVFDYQWSID